MPLHRHDSRTPAQQRAALLVGPVAIAAVVLFLLLAPFAVRALGRTVGVLLLGAAAVAPVVGLYRYAVAGRPRRRAALEGVAAGLLVAALYWLVWIAPLPEPWWLQP